VRPTNTIRQAAHAAAVMSGTLDLVVAAKGGAAAELGGATSEVSGTG
jgi:hypothetical protein